jgi:hypothetical protein
VGLGLGFLAGLLARGLVGGVGTEKMRFLARRLSRERPASLSRRAADRMAAALARDPDLAGLGLDPLPVRGGRVELHGWVPSRRVGARALRIAREAASEVELTNRLLVRGEDDAPPPPPAPAAEEERRPA